MPGSSSSSKTRSRGSQNSCLGASTCASEVRKRGAAHNLIFRAQVPPRSQCTLGGGSTWQAGVLSGCFRAHAARSWPPSCRPRRATPPSCVALVVASMLASLRVRLRRSATPCPERGRAQTWRTSCAGRGMRRPTSSGRLCIVAADPKRPLTPDNATALQSVSRTPPPGAVDGRVVISRRDLNN